MRALRPYFPFLVSILPDPAAGPHGLAGRVSESGAWASARDNTVVYSTKSIDFNRDDASTADFRQLWPCAGPWQSTTRVEEGRWRSWTSVVDLGRIRPNRSCTPRR